MKTFFLNKKQKIKEHIKTCWMIIAMVAKDFLQGKLPLRATSLVYTTILSFAPLLALSFSVLKSFGAHNQLTPFLESALAPLGEKGLEISHNILMFVDNIKVGVLGALGLGFLLFTVISLVQKIEAAYNDIWHVAKARPHIQRFTGYLSVVTIGPVVLIALLGLKAKFTTNPLVAETLGIATSVGFMPEFIAFISSIALPVALFTFMNKAIPNTKVNWIPAIVAAIITTFIWKGVASGLTTFLQNSTSYDAIYSSFAIIVVVFIWLYLNWLVILIGGSLCFYIQNPEQANISFYNQELGYEDKLYSSLVILKHMYKSFEKGRNPLKLQKASQLLGSHVLMDNIIHKLVDANILILNEESGELLFKRSVHRITLYEIVTALSGQKQVLRNYGKDKEIVNFIQKIEKEWKKTTLEQVLKK